MSLSSRKCASGGLTAVAASAAATLFAPAAGAADVFYQPIVSVSTAYNTNIDLDPVARQSAEGYFADAATTIGIATPRSETTLQPRLLYNYYPSASQRNRLEGFLNMNTRYSWERDRFRMTGFFDHRDDVNAEQPSATYNSVNPGLGNTTPGTGRILVGTTRNYVVVDPTYSHLLTPLSSVGIAAEYQRLTYSSSNAAGAPNTTGQVDFNYYQGRLFYAKTINQRTDIDIGAYASKYVASNIDSHSTAAGIQAGGSYNWSQTLQSSLTVQWQRTKFQENSPRVFDVTSNPWAASFTTVYKEQASSYTFFLGRTIYPSSAGGLYTTDQVRGQYDRDFTQRWHFQGAVRFFRDRTTTGVINNDTRNYLTGNLKLQYMLSPTMFVAGSYIYVYQKYHFDPTSAQANVVALSFGYRGLDRQR